MEVARKREPQYCRLKGGRNGVEGEILLQINILAYVGVYLITLETETC